MTFSEWTALGALFAGLWLIALAPFLYPFYVAVRRGKSVSRRWLFVVAATCMTYGLIMLLVTAVWLPLEFLVTKVAPQLKIDAPQIASWFNPALDFVYTWFHYVPLLLLFVLAFFNTRWLWKRWHKIAGVL